MSNNLNKEVILDYAALDQLRDLTQSAGAFVRIYSLFVTNTTNDIGLLAQLLRNNRIEEFRTETHRIKGGVGTIGATKLYQLLEDLYNAEKDDLIKNRADYMEGLRAALAETTLALEQYCRGKPDLQEIMLTTSAGE